MGGRTGSVHEATATIRPRDDFGERAREATGRPLACRSLDTLQVNVGFVCNQSCAHCHLGCSPDRTEEMDWPVMEMVADAAGRAGCRLVDITGGAPELNPHFRRFVSVLRERGYGVQVRTNLTALTDPGAEDLPLFLRDRGVALVGSMPCYLEQNVDAQRGPGVYDRSVRALKRLNELGYGCEDGPPLSLVYNPAGPALPPEQGGLEADYRKELGGRFGIRFTRLLTITNMAIGKFRDDLRRSGQEEDYLRLLRDSFNPDTVDGLMCRHQVSVGWDGVLYDCDFSLALGLPVDHGASNHISAFDPDQLCRRRIVTGAHCFGCTAGRGSSCAGALA